MSQKLRPERLTQNWVVSRIVGPATAGDLGYANLGDWGKREGTPAGQFWSGTNSLRSSAVSGA